MKELTEEEGLRITKQLGADAVVACNILSLSQHDPLSSADLAKALDLDLLEVERIMSKMQRLGLVG